MSYNDSMIQTFADKHTRDFFETGRSSRLPPDILSRAKRKLEYINLAVRLEALKVPPSNQLHRLVGDRSGQFAVSVNDQRRICFRYKDGDAYDVEIVDYH